MRFAVKYFTNEKMTLRMIAKEMGTNHHRIKRILVKNGVEITQKDRIRKLFTDEHKAKINKATKGRIEGETIVSLKLLSSTRRIVMSLAYATWELQDPEVQCPTKTIAENEKERYFRREQLVTTLVVTISLRELRYLHQFQKQGIEGEDNKICELMILALPDKAAELVTGNFKQ